MAASLPSPVSPSARRHGLILILLTVFAWSVIGLISKNCLAAGVSPLETAFWRAAIGAACFITHATLSRQIRIPLRHAALFTVFGFWAVGVFYAATLYATKLSGAAMAVVLLYTAPVWVAMFSRFLFHEPITTRQCGIIALALAGTGMVCFSGGSLPGQTSWTGIACGLLISVCYASHYPFCRWWQDRYAPATLYAFMQLGGAAVIFCLTPVSLDHSLSTWGWLLILGGFTGYFAFFCYAQALKRLGLVRTAVLCYLEPILSTIWVWLFWDEFFSPLGWAGSALVLAAVFWLNMDKSRAAS